MSISRRTALATGAAAITTGAIAAPLAVKATATKAALVGDPVAVLVRKAAAYEEWLNTIGGTVTDDEFNVLCAVHSEMEYEIRDTPSNSIEAIAGKVRIAWANSVIEIEAVRNGPPKEFDEFYPLDPARFIWSALQDLERLAGEARS